MPIGRRQPVYELGASCDYMAAYSDVFNMFPSYLPDGQHITRVLFIMEVFTSNFTDMTTEQV